MGDDITIGVTEIVNNIEVTAQPNDQIVDISVIDNADDVTLNITPTVIEINVNRGSSFAKWGTILGALSDQTDLQNALNLKANLVGGKVPASELPSYVDDVVEVANYAALPATGETGKIYVTLDNNKIYRWSGSVYIEIASNNAIWGAITGTLSSQTDLQAALDAKQDDLISGTNIKTIEGQSLLGSGNIDLTKSDVGLSNVDNTSDANKPISTATQTALDAKQNTITLTTIGTSGSSTLVGSTLNIPNYTTDISGLVPYTGATANVDLGTHKLTASDLVVNHASGSGVAASITKGGSGEALTVLKTSGSGNAASILGGVTLLDELHLNTDLADAYIASAATWNAKQAALNGTGFVKISGTTISYDNSTYALDSVVVKLSGSQTITGVKTFSNMPILSAASGVNGQIVYADASNQLKTITNFKYNDATGVLTTQLGDLGSNAYTSTAYVPTSRTLTINGTAYDLSADRSWTISGLPSMLEFNDTDKTVWNNGKGNIATSTSFGDGALKTNTSGGYNTAFGVLALNLNTTGSANTAVSTYTLSNNTSGYNNTGIGYESLLTNTTGYDNTAVGADALVNNVGGNSNSAVGYGALSSNTSGISNASVGKYALGANTTGNYNVGIGDNAGNSTLGGGTLNTTSAQSTYIGAFASCSANGVTNEIAIGYASSGNGSNSVTLGNTSITKTILRGNVGIGTTSPSDALHVATSNEYQISWSRTIAGKRWALGVDSGATFIGNRTDNTIPIYITNGGNVGIGTTSPSTKLAVNGSFSSQLSDANDIRLIIAPTASLIQIAATYNTTGSFQPLGFFTSDVERMRITSGGNVLVNLTSTSAYLDGKFNSFGNSTVPAACFKTESSGQFTTSFWNAASGTVTLQQFVHGTGQTLVGSISTNGTITSYNITSDYRLKQDFKSFNGLDLVSKIKVYDYQWKADNSRMNGVIAHELQEVVPYAVTGEKDAEKMQSVDYSKLVPILVQAIQEQQKQIEELKTLINK